MPKVKATAKWIENVRSVVDNSRTHSVVCDLSTSAGGNDTGPTALELAVMALADCAVTIFADVCKRLGAYALQFFHEFVESEATVVPYCVDDQERPFLAYHVYYSL